MAESVVSLTYGDALFEAAEEVGKKEQIYEEIMLTAQIVKENPELSEFLGNPTISSKEKKSLIEKALGEKFCHESINFLFVLIDKGRTWEIRRIAKHYAKRYNQSKGMAEGKIYSVIPLSEQQITNFEKEMSKLLQKKVKLRNKIDKGLIGGVVLQVDGRIIDKSLKYDLDRLLLDLKNI